MIQRLLAYGLLLLQLTMIILPEVPYLVFFCHYDFKHEVAEVSNSIKNEKPLVGDLTYLKALLDRAIESSDKTEEQKLPERSFNVNSLVYLISEKISNASLICQSVKDYFFKTYSILLQFGSIPSPPPKFE
jgi:hypothetical protein